MATRPHTDYVDHALAYPPTILTSQKIKKKKKTVENSFAPRVRANHDFKSRQPRF
jgi:hypothetical protein